MDINLIALSKYPRIVRIQDFLAKLAYLDMFPLFIVYLIMIAVIPKPWQRYTKPLELKTVLVLYNLLCSVLNIYATAGMVWVLLNADVVYTNTSTPNLIPYYKVYAFTKILELMDTVFMILRHRSRQITFLHVFHHSSMLILIHYALQYSPWTALAPCLALNSFVHVVLYFYYGLTIYDSSHRPSWKRRLTELQILQFIVDLAYGINGYLHHQFCIWSVLYGLSMLTLFTNFYVKAYLSSKTRDKSNTRNGAGDLASGTLNGAKKSR